jgi:hypothetical protein
VTTKPGRRDGKDSPKNVLMVRSKVKAESVAEVEAAITKVFSAIERAQPAGVRYASSRLEDGVTFVALLELEGGVDNPSRHCQPSWSSRRTSRSGCPGRRLWSR